MYTKVFKFGGASLKDATGVKNVASIIGSQPAQNLLVVVSAMGKTTNMLERIINLFKSGKDYNVGLQELRSYHYDILSVLFVDPTAVIAEIELHFSDIQNQLSLTRPVDEMYDQVVSKGELISSIIVHRYLVSENVACHWHDSRETFITDNNFREGRLDWSKTLLACASLKPILRDKIIITQGFIGKTEDGLTTTLGREGSDYSAAIFASCLDADSVVIWKDVPGVMNADPKRIENATIFEELPFKEAAEMTYYGASVIHPKTIKPLATKGIPLYVKMFSDPTRP